MECVIALLTNAKKALSWGEVKGEFNKSTFLDSVLKFNIDNTP